jgi:hypothetical protein
MQSSQPYSYCQFCQKYHDWLGTKGITGKIIRYPGQNIEVDYAGMYLYLKNKITGKYDTKVTVFAAAMSYSKYYYAEGMTMMNGFLPTQTCCTVSAEQRL